MPAVEAWYARAPGGPYFDCWIGDALRLELQGSRAVGPAGYAAMLAHDSARQQRITDILEQSRQLAGGLTEAAREVREELRRPDPPLPRGGFF